MSDKAKYLREMAGWPNAAPCDVQFLRDLANMLDKPRVIVESPYKAADPETVERNVRYARRAMHDSLRRGESPFLSHLLYTQVLCEEVHADRRLGIAAGLVWGEIAQKTVVYIDYGISVGMHEGIDRAKNENRLVLKRAIGENP